VSLREAFRVAMQALVANRLRSALTTLGVLIGVLSVVLLVAIGQGARQEITGAIEGLGSNLLFVLPGDGDFGQAPARSRFTIEDVERSTASCRVGSAGGRLQCVGREPLQADGQRLNATVNGVTASYLEVVTREVARGRDSASRRRDRPPGRGARRQHGRGAVPGQDPIGRTVTIGGIRFRVIGVLEGSVAAAFGPDRTARSGPGHRGQRLFGTDRIDAIFVRATSTARSTRTARVERALGQRLDVRTSSRSCRRTRSSGSSATSCRS
jgi:putative ABC transport system permease protein